MRTRSLLRLFGLTLLLAHARLATAADGYTFTESYSYSYRYAYS